MMFDGTFISFYLLFALFLDCAVGAGLGLFIFLSFCAFLFLGSANTGNNPYGLGLLLFAAMLLSTIVPIIIILALLTPKQCKSKK